MAYGRCVCGKREFWGSGMEPAPCSPCEECGAVPAAGPNLHPDPVPHDFSLTSDVETDEGPKPLTRCRYCFKTRAQIAKGVGPKAKQAVEK